jgi:Fur family transcriptional regulator, ferric uptake regulator
LTGNLSIIIIVCRGAPSARPAQCTPDGAPRASRRISPFIRLFRRYLKEQGLPVTQQREVVADVVFTSLGAPLGRGDRGPMLRERGERIGKATIYRTIEILVRSGLVEEHDFGEGFKRYEHLFGQQPEHEHLICTHCSKVVEFQSPEVMRVQDEVARAARLSPDAAQAGDLRHLRGLPGAGRDGVLPGADLPGDRDELTRGLQRLDPAARPSVCLASEPKHWSS